MIDPKSLRIGNYIHSHGEVFTVDMVSKDSVRAGGLTITSLGLSSYDYGIPLSEQDLIRLGFERVHGAKMVNIGLLYWAQDALLLFFNSSPPENTYLVGYGFNVGSEYYAANGRWIDTVHDLQNIYREWKGTELNYKP